MLELGNVNPGTYPCKQRRAFFLFAPSLMDPLLLVLPLIRGCRYRRRRLWLRRRGCRPSLCAFPHYSTQVTLCTTIQVPTRSSPSFVCQILLQGLLDLYVILVGRKLKEGFTIQSPFTDIFILYLRGGGQWNVSAIHR